MSTPLHAHRTRSCGVQLAAQLVWSKWEPGGEYVKAITIKNLSKKVRATAPY
jgi:hypothetical protein